MTLQIIRTPTRHRTERWRFLFYSDDQIHTLGELNIPSRYTALLRLLLNQGCTVTRVRLLEQDP